MTNPDDMAFSDLDGMTKRELYAGFAMLGILSSHIILNPGDSKNLATVCWLYADDLIAGSNKEVKP